ncbi:MAG: hypothetical protein IPH41_08410 [Sulfuritalea sp.]|nr:hypothetical protein [Sulfuritalea sp.]
MQRFDENGRLDHMAARGELQPAHLEQLAATLCAFQQAAPRAATGTSFGAPQQVLAAARENFVELRQLPPGRKPVEQLANWTEPSSPVAPAISPRGRRAFHPRGPWRPAWATCADRRPRHALRLHRVQRGLPLGTIRPARSPSSGSTCSTMAGRTWPPGC